MLYPNLTSKRIILASKSPRRLELVRGLELEPEVLVRDVDESYPLSLMGPEVAEFVTRAKAAAFTDMLGLNDVIITGDTVVLLDNEILEKPSNFEEAALMLRKLSGRTHVVASGIAVTTLRGGKPETSCEVDTCEVTFEELTDDMISHYIDSYKPFDKAGSYGVQDLIGFIGVSSINGSFYTVMGLPVHILHKMLQEV
ncbi:MAG: septum formation protein Maf [Flavobacteriales bacterium]|jgi:septum formation protein|nr:septum formation protein Maf [Flavobacteriales bacterium]MBT6174738.1 septum formation protein Maf [Flavobacteriales bacterium]